MRRIFRAGLCLAYALPLSPVAFASDVVAQADDTESGACLMASDGTFSVSAAIPFAFAHHPGLSAFESAWRGAKAQVTGADAWDEPQLSLTLAPLSLASDASPPGQGLRISQKLPWPGSPTLRARMAGERANIRAAEWQGARTELALALRLALADAWEADRALEVNAHHIERTRERLASAEAALRAGRADLQAPLRAESRLAELDQATLRLQAQRSMALARLNTLLGRPAAAPLPPLPRSLDPTREGALDGAACPKRPGYRPASPEPRRDERPEVQAARHAVALQRDAVALADVARWPEISLDAQYSSMFMQPEHQWMLGAGLKLPLAWEARSAGLASARALLRQAEAQEAQRRLDVEWEVAAAEIALREVEGRARVLATQALPAAHARLATALSGYESGQGAFEGVLEAENALREIELAHARARADQHRAAARRLRARGLMQLERDPTEGRSP